MRCSEGGIVAGFLASITILAGLLILAFNHPVAHLQEIAIGLGCNLVALGAGIYLVERVLLAHSHMTHLEAISPSFLLPVALLNEHIGIYATVARENGKEHPATKVVLKYLHTLGATLNDLAHSMPVDVSVEARSEAAELMAGLRKLYERPEAVNDAEQVARTLRTNLRRLAEKLGGPYLVSTAVDGSGIVKRTFDKMAIPVAPLEQGGHG